MTADLIAQLESIHQRLAARKRPPTDDQLDRLSDAFDIAVALDEAEERGRNWVLNADGERLRVDDALAKVEDAIAALTRPVRARRGR